MEHFYIGRELKKTSLLMKRTMGLRIRNIAGTDITAFQMDVIFFIQHSERDIFQKDLEKEFGLKRPTVSLGLNHMEELGLIERRSVESDARLKKITITKRALDIVEKAGMVVDNFEKSIQEKFNNDEIENLMHCFEKLQNILKSLDTNGDNYETKQN